MDNNERKRKKAELDALELNIEELNKNVNTEDLTMDEGDLPSLSNNPIQQLDYETQLQNITKDSEAVINSLAELYLGNEVLYNHPYVSEKRKKDADYYGKLRFLVNTSEKTLINAMREIDMGNAGPRMFEIQSMLQKETRENIKLTLRSLSDIEKFYKSIRKDLGLSESVKIQEEEAVQEKAHLSMKELNNQLEDILKNTDEDYAIDDED